SVVLTKSSDRLPNSGVPEREVTMYDENTQLYSSTPPSLPTIVGMAALTTVASMAKRKITSRTPATATPRLYSSGTLMDFEKLENPAGADRNGRSGSFGAGSHALPS